MRSLFQSGNGLGFSVGHGSVRLLRASSSSAPAHLLYGIKVVCWGLGILALAYVGWVMGDAAVRQARSRETLAHLEEQPFSKGSIRAPAHGFLLADLDIPRIGLSVMVTEGTDEKTLRVGAGHLAGSGFPGGAGNVVIAGHRDTFFRPLRNIRVGDLIDLTSPEGTYQYRVEWTRVVPPTDTQALDSTSTPALTLVTCYPFSYIGPAPERFVVRASLNDDR